jgi:mycothiol synthase
MSPSLSDVRPADHDELRALLAHPSVAREFELLQGEGGLENVLGDPFCPSATQVVARENGAAVGFAFAFLPRSGDHPWAMFRVAVPEPHGRRGTGGRLLDEVVRRVLALEPRCAELCLSAWRPCDAAEALAAGRGFREVRRFWLMERPRGPVPAPEWPAGIEVRSFDGSAPAVADLTQVYNESFARHYHYFPATLDDTRALTGLPRFEPEGLLLAYRDGACVGYCRCERMPARGEVASLGVVESARGAGLGRALLRWGTDWLERCNVPSVTLAVDGENENALGLYRSEGYVVARTRPIWSKPVS